MPPGWAFGVVWPILYALMGIALAMILAEPPSPRRKSALILFFVQLALNFAWSPIFFAGHDIALAKIVIFVMAVARCRSRRASSCGCSKPAGLLLIPYLAWLVFAATLNCDDRGAQSGAGTSLRCAENWGYSGSWG